MNKNLFKLFSALAYVPALLITVLIFSASLAFAATNASLPQTVVTDSGEIRLPTSAELDKAQQQIANDSSLDNDSKKKQLADLDTAVEQLDNATSFVQSLNELNKELRQSAQTIRSLSSNLYKTEKQFAQIPSSSNVTSQQITSLVESTRRAGTTAQSDYSSAVSAYNELQTLPERAQSTVTKNNQSISEINKALSQERDLSSISAKIKALGIYTLSVQNELLQTQLENHTELLDIANYRMRIAGIKNTYYQNYLQELSDRQNQLLSEDGNDESDDALAELAIKHPELQSELNTNRSIQGYITDYRQKSAALSADTHKVDAALSTVKQLHDSVGTEIDGLDKSLLLSRLLNRQQSQIPDLTLSANLDELIPDLTLWLYDLRAGRDRLFDVNAYADELIAKNNKLANVRDSLVDIVLKRRQLLNELYQAMSSQLTVAINLKLKYQDFVDLRNKTNSLITENLFWLRSNQPIGKDYLATFIPNIANEFSHFNTQLHNIDYWKSTGFTALILGIPSLFIASLLFWSNSYLRRINNRVAGRLDRRNDSILVTPLAILLNFIMVLPKVLIWVLCGAIIICLCLDNSHDQIDVIGMLLLHILVFVYLLEILKPNSLAQRHFSMNPYSLQQDRKLLTGIWYALIPILIVANIVETKSSAIFYDSIGFLVIILCAISMVVVSFRWIRTQLHSTDEMSSFLWFISIAGFIAPLAIAIAVANGYYYTTIKLVNRLAYTFYTVIGYWIVSNTVHRAVYVFQSKLQRKSLEQVSTNEENGTKNHETNLSFIKESLGLENISAKAFKLLNTVLICLTLTFMYFQWSDLAGALGYLKNIVLWSHTEIESGKEVVSDVLTLADVLVALLIIVVTVLLNRNLPSLLERMFLWKAVGAQHRSTSYTVKIISSYIIMSLGTMFAAGAIGVKWENLQWLVAALSVGLGFGLQEIFANFVSGIIILFERQIRVGDIVTLNGLSGTVNRIRIRSTTILSFENKEVMIPNREFLTSALTNWSLTNTVTKLEFSVGIGYSSDVNRAKSILSNIIRKCRYTAKGMAPLIYVKSLDDSAVTIMCEIYVAEIGKRKLAIDYLCSQTLGEFARNNIEIPFNQMDVNVKNLESGEFLEAFKHGHEFAATPKSN